MNSSRCLLVTCPRWPVAAPPPLHCMGAIYTAHIIDLSRRGHVSNLTCTGMVPRTEHRTVNTRDNNSALSKQSIRPTTSYCLFESRIGGVIKKKRNGKENVWRFKTVAKGNAHILRHRYITPIKSANLVTIRHQASATSPMMTSSRNIMLLCC